VVLDLLFTVSYLLEMVWTPFGLRLGGRDVLTIVLVTPFESDN
jgi:hypothetical protein